MNRPDKPGVWVWWENGNGPFVARIEKISEWGPAEWAYVGPVPERPKRPATDKEIADAARALFTYNRSIQLYNTSDSTDMSLYAALRELVLR